MRHRTLRTFVLCSAVVICVAVGTVVGVGLRRHAGEETTTALVEAPAEAFPPEAATDPTGSGAARAEEPAVSDADEAGATDQDGESADPGANAAGNEGGGEQAPPEGEERAPGFNPQIPDPGFEPLPLPNWNPNGNGGQNGAGNNGNGNAQPQPEPTPLSIFVVGPSGPGPIWERNGPGICGLSDHSERTYTFITVAVHQVPRATPYTVTGTARAGNTVVQARVEQERGQPHRFRVYYSFPRGTVRAPAYIAVNARVTDAQGNVAVMAQVGGRAGVGHRLYPADYCP